MVRPCMPAPHARASFFCGAPPCWPPACASRGAQTACSVPWKTARAEAGTRPWRPCRHQPDKVADAGLRRQAAQDCDKHPAQLPSPAADHHHWPRCSGADRQGPRRPRLAQGMRRACRPALRLGCSPPMLCPTSDCSRHRYPSRLPPSPPPPPPIHTHTHTKVLLFTAPACAAAYAPGSLALS